MFPYYCNKCFRRRKYEISLELFVSRCRHILCNTCIQENCCICNRSFNPVAINRGMPSSMADYFSSPIKQYQHYKKVMKFHHEQERRLVEHLCSRKREESKEVQIKNEGYAKLNEKLKEVIQRERERIRKLREYIAYYDRRLEQARYMTPPITMQARPRFPQRSHCTESTVNANLPKRFSQQIRPNLIFPNSPTLSGNNSASVTTEDTTTVSSTHNKSRTPPPLLPLSQHKEFNQQCFFNSPL